MEKKTVNISEQLINSILISLLLSLVIVVAGHLQQSNWSFIPETNYSGGKIMGGSIQFSGDAKVSSCSFEWVMFQS